MTALSGLALYAAAALAAIAGRSYATLCGVYVTASRLWLWLAEGHAPIAGV